MNFFSHFYHEYPVESPYYLYGLVLPDIENGFNAAYRPMIKKVLPAENTPEKEIHRGIYAHWQADKWFHNHELFKTNTHQTVLHLKKFPQLQRTFFLAHIAVEMYLDKVLIEQNHHKLVEYYQFLGQVERKNVANYFALIAKSQEEEVLWERFNRFVSEAFLYVYTDNEKLMQALSRTYFRAIKKTPDFTFDQLEEVLQHLENNLRKDYLELFS